MNKTDLVDHLLDCLIYWLKKRGIKSLSNKYWWKSLVMFPDKLENYQSREPRLSLENLLRINFSYLQARLSVV